LQDAINCIADDLEAWDNGNSDLSLEQQQEKIKIIFDKCKNFCLVLTKTFPIYEHLCQDFLYGEYIKISTKKLEIHPFKNFQTLMVEILRSLKPFFKSAKIITVLFQLPRTRFLSEFRVIKQNNYC